MSLFPLLFWKEQLCHVYGEVESVVYNTEWDVVTAQERSGRAPTTGSVSLTVCCAAALICTGPWSGRSSHPHLVKSYSIREKADVHLSCVSVWIPQIPPQSLNAGSDLKSPPVGLLPCSSGLYLLKLYFLSGCMDLYCRSICRSGLGVWNRWFVHDEEPADPQTITKG